MLRSLLVAILVLGLLLNGCATSRDIQRAGGPACPADNSHVSWCGEHPIMTGAAVGLLVVGGVIVAGILAQRAHSANGDGAPGGL